ncbi:glycosyltransferase family 2 protein [Oceanobacillus timonensis]|uniref:glycosyltransferase family 2 protein n=1 Tax=Oceanobacillus timonensis TaxID=1926285 RepID=UPI001FEB8710|nr:glycosyltransferase family 2 protein [Oceanobacillus timonensis]
MALQELIDFSSYILKKSNQSIQLSIIIPVFNREDTIQGCLDKLKNITYNKENLEIIIVDDCSTDQTFEALSAYEVDFPNLSLLRRKDNSGGASLPRNDGMKIATGKWILFLDSDDYITSHAIADAMKVVETSPKTDMVCMPYFRKEGSKRPISRSAFNYSQTITNLHFLQTKLYNSLNAVGKMFKRSIIENYNISFPSHIKVREDNWFMMKIYSVSDNIAILGNQKSYYFIGEKDEASLSRGNTPPRDAVKIFISVYDFIQALPIKDEQKYDYLTLYLNRYSNMIKRGKHAPLRFFEHTKETLEILLNNPLLSGDAKNFIQDLFHGKYNIVDKESSI